MIIHLKIETNAYHSCANIDTALISMLERMSKGQTLICFNKETPKEMQRTCDNLNVYLSLKNADFRTIVDVKQKGLKRYELKHLKTPNLEIQTREIACLPKHLAQEKLQDFLQKICQTDLKLEIVYSEHGKYVMAHLENLTNDNKTKLEKQLDIEIYDAASIEEETKLLSAQNLNKLLSLVFNYRNWFICGYDKHNILLMRTTDH